MKLAPLDTANEDEDAVEVENVEFNVGWEKIGRF
jgi:hypothetical protein